MSRRTTLEDGAAADAAPGGPPGSPASLAAAAFATTPTGRRLSSATASSFSELKASGVRAGRSFRDSRRRFRTQYLSTSRSPPPKAAHAEALEALEGAAEGPKEAINGVSGAAFEAVACMEALGRALEKLGHVCNSLWDREAGEVFENVLYTHVRPTLGMLHGVADSLQTKLEAIGDLQEELENRRLLAIDLQAYQQKLVSLEEAAAAGRRVDEQRVARNRVKLEEVRGKLEVLSTHAIGELAAYDRLRQRVVKPELDTLTRLVAQLLRDGAAAVDPLLQRPGAGRSLSDLEQVNDDEAEAARTAAIVKAEKIARSAIAGRPPLPSKRPRGDFLHIPEEVGGGVGVGVGANAAIAEVESYAAPRAVVDWRYVAETEQELDMHVGETLEILQEDASGWWRGRNSNGDVGWFPANHVHLRRGSGVSEALEASHIERGEASTQVTGFAQTLFPFRGSTAKDLSLPNDALVGILYEDPSGWWRGRYLDDEGAFHEGWFPGNHVARVDTASEGVTQATRSKMSMIQRNSTVPTSAPSSRFRGSAAK